MTATPRSVEFRTEIGSLPHRDRSSSAPRSVEFRVEIGSRRRSDAGRAPGRLVPGLGALSVGRVAIPCGLEAVTLLVARGGVFPRSRGAGLRPGARSRASTGPPGPQGRHRPAPRHTPWSQSSRWVIPRGVASDARSAGLPSGCSASRSPGAVPGSLAEIGPRRWPEIGLFRPEAGLVRRSGGPLGAAVPREVIIPRTFSFPRRPARTAEPRNHADSHGVRGCWPA